MSKALAAVLACAICMALGQATLFVGTFPVFLPAISQTFGWGAGVFPQALLVAGAANALAALFGGQLVDRFGVRSVVVVSLIGWAASLFALSMIDGSKVQLLVVAATLGAVTCFNGPVALAKVVAGWFDQHRGLALAIALGVAPAAGSAVMVVLANTLIATHGWRFTYQVLAGLVIIVSIPVTLLFMREAPSTAPAPANNLQAREEGSVRGALLGVNFWMIVLVTTLICTVVSAVTAHLVAWSAEYGVSQTAAVFALSAYSLACPLGTVVSGIVADRSRGPKPLAVFYALPLIGLTLLPIFGAAALIPAVALFGAGFGAASGLLPFLMTRYFGTQHAAQLIGIGIGLFVLLLGVGPVALGYVHDQFNSFAPAVPVLFVLLAAGVAACLNLRQYHVTPLPPPPPVTPKKPVDA